MPAYTRVWTKICGSFVSKKAYKPVPEKLAHTNATHMLCGICAQQQSQSIQKNRTARCGLRYYINLYARDPRPKKSKSVPGRVRVQPVRPAACSPRRSGLRTSVQELEQIRREAEIHCHQRSSPHSEARPRYQTCTPAPPAVWTSMPMTDDSALFLFFVYVSTPFRDEGGYQ